MRALVTGAGGFIGHHLVKRLKAEGYWVRGVDQKAPEFEPSSADEFELRDLRRRDEALLACRGSLDWVFQLAADMGGMGFISRFHHAILTNNSLINTHVLEAASAQRAGRYFFSSSACIYPEHIQTTTDVRGLRETDAYPANPQDAYGWEKLLAEQACAHASAETGLTVRVARFHNIYGPLGTWTGGREKAPAALCRKVAEAKLAGRREIEVWGDGEATRSFCYIDDCIEGILRLMRSSVDRPINLGSDRLISVNDLARLTARVSGHEVELRHVEGPEGVRGRNSDNTLIRSLLGWAPAISLEEGIALTYPWIEEQVRRCAAL